MLPSSSRYWNDIRSWIAETACEVPSNYFTRTDVQDMLDAAQLEAGRLYADTPYLCNTLQTELCQALETCNYMFVDPIQVLNEQLRIEFRILDAYNKHRLGRAKDRCTMNVIEPDDAVDYDAWNNIPDELDYFPFRMQVSLRGVDITAPQLYQDTSQYDGKPLSQPATAASTETKHQSPTHTMHESPTLVSSEPPVHATNENTSPGKKKQGRGAENYDKLADAPSSHLGFPEGNMTLAEILCFVPQSIKSWDIIDRLLHNGALTITFTDIINHFRTMPNGFITNNSVYRMMKGPMDRRGEKERQYRGWSVLKHRGLTKPAWFDPASVSVAGFRAPINNNKREAAAAATEPAPRILFRDLAKGVRVMPTGHDALDLTRCVRHCVEHPDEDWYYPQDFVELILRLPHDPDRISLIGPVPVQLHHQDRYALKRYAFRPKREEPSNIPESSQELRDILVKKEEMSDFDEGDTSVSSDLDIDESGDYVDDE